MKVLKLPISILLIISILITPVSADIDSMLDNVIGGIYVQEPGIYKSPSTTTLSGGSISFRLRNDAIGRPIIRFRAPRIGLSCSGMDFDAGLMALLNLDQFEQMLSQAGASLAWGIMIGIVYSLPGIGEAFQKLNEWAREIQKLFQNPCQRGKEIGTAIGAHISKVIKNEGTVEKAEEKTKETGTPFERAIKKALEYITPKDTSKTLPYAALREAGITDNDILDLFAGLFGVMDVYLEHNGQKVTDPTKNMSNACGGPCDEKNIKVVLRAPKTSVTINGIINGGDIETYHCSGFGVGGTDSCQSITDDTITTTGLLRKVASVVSYAIDAYSAGNPIDPDTQQKINRYNAMVPQLAGTLHYAAAMKKYRSASGNSEATRIARAMSEYVSIMIVYEAIELMHGFVFTSVGSNLAEKKPQMINQYLNNVEQARRHAVDYIRQKSANYELVVQASETYKYVVDNAMQQIKSTLGPGVMLSLR